MKKWRYPCQTKSEKNLLKNLPCTCIAGDVSLATTCKFCLLDKTEKGRLYQLSFLLDMTEGDGLCQERQKDNSSSSKRQTESRLQNMYKGNRTEVLTEEANEAD